MKKVWIWALLIVMFVGLVISPGVGTAANELKLEEYLVQFDGPASKGLFQALGVADADILHEFDMLPVLHLKLTPQQAQALARHPQIKYVEKNAQAHAIGQTVPWGIPRVQAPEVHDLGYTGKGIKVAILDTGIDNSHEDLNVKGGYSVFTDSANQDPFYDGNGHGTHVAGTVAALDNQVGVIGVAHQAELYAVKVLNNSGSGSYAGIAQGIEWAIQNNMDVINMSLGGTFSSSILKEWCDLAYQEGILLIAAAGNSGNILGIGDTVNYPAKYDSVVAVAAINENNRRASFSSTGPAVELSAPGVNVLSTVPGNRYESYSGTSMASPHVAGVAALVWQAKPELSNVELRLLLQETAKYLGSSNYYGYGLVQAKEAIQK